MEGYANMLLRRRGRSIRAASGQAPLATADHRLCRTVHERRAGGRPAHRPLHGEVREVTDADMDPVIGHVMADSPAAKAGIQDGDRIVKLDGRTSQHGKMSAWKEISSAYRPMHLTIERAGNVSTPR